MRLSFPWPNATNRPSGKATPGARFGQARTNMLKPDFQGNQSRILDLVMRQPEKRASHEYT
jgi:hypothetical protein